MSREDGVLRQQKGCERWTGHLFAHYGSCDSVPGRNVWKTLFNFPSEDKFLYCKRGENWHGGKETDMKGRERKNYFFPWEV